MGVMVGGSHVVKWVWREKGNDEKWAVDCMEKKLLWGTIVMCWGMIQYGHKGPFHA